MSLHEMDCAILGGQKEQYVSLKITQLMLHKFMVDGKMSISKKISAKT